MKPTPAQLSEAKRLLLRENPITDLRAYRETDYPHVVVNTDRHHYMRLGQAHGTRFKTAEGAERFAAECSSAVAIDLRTVYL